LKVKNVVEYILPGSTLLKTISYYEGDYNLNLGKPFALKAGTTYTINLELWGGNAIVTRDFSIVAHG
jgi:hypothetical protein